MTHPGAMSLANSRSGEGFGLALPAARPAELPAGGDDAPVGRLAYPAHLVSPQITMERLDGLFRANASLRWVVMDQPGSPVLISRSWFDIVMAGRLGYGRLILGSRPLGDVAPRDTVLFSADTPVDRVAAAVTPRRGDGKPVDGVVVVGADGSLGVAAVAEVFEQLAKQYAYHALHDPLTGLPNRLFLLDRLQEDGPESPHGVLCFVDLDRFKDVNDHLGHAAGDQVLVEFAARLRSVARIGDTVVRLSGDEFAVLTREPLTTAQSTALAERIVLAAMMPFVVDSPGTAGGGEQIVTVGASVGVAASGGVGSAPRVTLLDLLTRGDLAMYRAKSLGRGRIAHFDADLLDDAEATDSVRARHLMERRLRMAIEAGGLAVHYQPVVALPSGQVTGVEALARWDDEELGSVSPDVFIALAERTGLIVDLGRWVLRTACAVAAAWPGGSSDVAPTVAVNVSAVQLAERGFIDDVTEALASSGLAPRRLCLEITETAAITDLASTAARLEQLRALGVRLALDDFGAGHSSLTLLRSLPVHLVKIDRSFVEKVTRDTADAVLVRLVVEAAHSLGRRVCAEGVETVDQARQLIALGCDAAQGWLFGRPQPPTGRLATVLAERAPSPDLSGEDAAALPLGASDELVLVTSPDRVITYASASVSAVLGWRPQELVRMPVGQLLASDDSVAEADPRAAEADADATLRRARHRDGSWRWLELKTRRLADEDGTLREILLVARDVTTTVEVQRALGASEAMFRHAFDDAPIGMAISDFDGRLMRVNKAFAGLLGTTPDRLRGRCVSDITHPDDRAADVVNTAERLYGRANAHSVVKRFLHADGTTVQVQVLTSVVQDATSAPAHVFAHVLPTGGHP